MVEQHHKQPQDANNLLDNFKSERLKYIDEVGNNLAKQYLVEAQERVVRGQHVKDKFMEIIEIANSAHKKFTLLLQQEASKPQSENVLTHELAIYKSCLHIDSDRLKQLLDTDIHAQKSKFQEVQEKSQESVKAFEKFQSMQQEMFDKFIKQQQNMFVDKSPASQEGPRGLKAAAMQARSQAANKSQGQFTSKLTEVEWNNLSQEIRNFTLELQEMRTKKKIKTGKFICLNQTLAQTH